MAESVANRRYSHNSRKRSAQVGDIAPAAVRHSFVRTPYVCRPFRVVFLCAAFVVLKEIQIRFSLARLPPFLPPRVHPSHRNPLSRRRSILVTSSIAEEEGGSGGRKEERKDEEIVSQGHLCNQVTTAMAMTERAGGRLWWCNTGME